MKLPAYPSTKPGGVEWLGDVPEHWEVKRISLLAARETGSFTDGDWIESPYITDEGVRLIQTGNVGTGRYREQGHRYVTEETFRELRCTQVRPKDVLICRLAAPVGRACLAPDLGCKMITSVDVCILRPAAEVDPRFVVYFFSSKDYLDWLDVLCRGSTRDRISRSMLGALRGVLPPLAEQRSIAAFLDRETGRVNRLVAKKRELIERLKEKRTALISRTVTRGLPPAAARAAGLPANPPLKPSGIEWIGEIPEHWDIVAYKRVCTRVDVGIAEAATHAYCDDGVPIIRSTNVKPNKLDTSDVLRIEPWFAAKNRSKTLRAGDLVTVRTGYPGTTAAVPPEFDGCQCFTLVLSTPKRTAHGPFFSWVLNSHPGASYFEMEGWGTAQTNISVPIVRFMPVPRPPIPEQAAIAAYLDEETAKLDALVGMVEEAVERLQEYRTALITAAVTGKIDVRAAVDSTTSTPTKVASTLAA